jgi:AcrR family transcriptional regulator
MGRIAGVSSEETRTRLLTAAAAVFGRRGYDGASIAEITSEAGLSSGAVYAHFGSKAALFAATLQAHGASEVERLLAVGGGAVDVSRLLLDRGSRLARRSPAEGSLLVEAIVAAKRHPDVAALLVSTFVEREARLADLVRGAQADGVLDADVAPATAARFVLMLVLGSLLVAAIDLPPTDRQDWSTLIASLLERFAPNHRV